MDPSAETPPGPPPREIPSAETPTPPEIIGGMSDADYNARLDELVASPTGAHAGIEYIADMGDSYAVEAAVFAETPVNAPDGIPDNVAQAQTRIAEGSASQRDVDLVDNHFAGKNNAEGLAKAREALSKGNATPEQRALVARDIAEREANALSAKKADFAELQSRLRPDGTLEDPEDQVRYTQYVTEKTKWEDLSQRAQAGETLSDDDKYTLAEGDKMWKEASDDTSVDNEIVDETEEARLERIQGELSNDTDLMLQEKDPQKRALLIDKIAANQAELNGIKQSKADRERDAKVIREVFGGERKGNLVNTEQSKRNERVQQLLDQMLADAAELLMISRQMEAVDKQRKALVAKINAEKKRLGHSATPMDKFVQIQEVVPLYRQLSNLDDRVDAMKDASYTFADRYYSSILEVRRRLKTRGLLMRVVETVALGSLRYSADIQKYGRRASRTLLG
ncbi:MAG: hypothetical protein UZ22_OP11002000145 [Microgenomates bacterium OLB23]|nr:MAG: hypothetical protein UZ22_OP11002000145 [Microgenomates bacterium OLB23]